MLHYMVPSGCLINIQENNNKWYSITIYENLVFTARNIIESNLYYTVFKISSTCYYIDNKNLKVLI